MADPTALYSYQGQEPQLLPNKIRLSDNTSRTDVSTYTDEEIADAGFTGPYECPYYNEKTQELIWDSGSFTYIIRDLYEPEPVVEDIIPEPEPIMDEKTFWNIIRNVRDTKLRDSDWAVNTNLLDNNLTESQINSWMEYRQKLRDFPETLTYTQELVERINPEVLSQMLPIPPSGIVTF